jgi:hypothetical protein
VKEGWTGIGIAAESIAVVPVRERWEGMGREEKEWGWEIAGEAAVRLAKPPRRKP